MTTTHARDLAQRLRQEATAIATLWLDRLDQILKTEKAEIFPGTRLLDHIPEIIARIADYLDVPGDLEISADTAVMAKATELGTMRHTQGATVHQLIREYQILGELFEVFVRDELAAHPREIEAGEALRCMSRLMRAVWVLQYRTVDAFIACYTDTIRHQTDLLVNFNRLISHEIRQPLNVIRITSDVLDKLPAGDTTQVERFAATLKRNVIHLTEIANKLERMVRVERIGKPSLSLQKIELSELVTDIAGQLQDMATARGVTIEVAADLPEIAADSARVELVFVNLMANAIKYADPAKPSRFVRVSCGSDGATVVADNGIGIPPERLSVIFEEFVRVHQDRDSELGIDGLGLGLTIVRDSMTAMDGAITVESTVGAGTRFTLRWPQSPTVSA